MINTDKADYEILDATVNKCTKCNRGYIGRTKIGVILECQCMQVYQYLHALAKAGIPRRYWSLALDDLHISEAAKTAAHFYIDHLQNAVKKSLGMMLMGTSGIGKTSIACEIAKEAIVEGIPTMYLTARQHVDSVFNKEPLDFSLYSLVIIDEIDKVSVKAGSDGVLNIVEDLLRINVPNRAVIACSNMSTDEMTELFGPATVSLIRRGMKMLPMVGTDYSHQVQSDWTSEMNSDLDYYQLSITERAKRLEDRIIREETEAWSARK